MLRVRPRASLFALVAVASFLACTLTAAAGNSPPAGAPPEVINIQEYEYGITPPGIQLNPGENVTFHITNVGTQTHNFYLDVGGSLAKTPDLAPGDSANVTFQVPKTGIIQYYCNIPGHEQLGMEGNLTVTGSQPVAPAKTITPGEIRVLGVSYYAYWVGVVSFIGLFVVLAATFFVLRYGETTHWTDQRARPARDKGETAPKTPVGTYVVLGLTLVLFLVALVEVVRVV